MWTALKELDRHSGDLRGALHSAYLALIAVHPATEIPQPLQTEFNEILRSFRVRDPKDRNSVADGIAALSFADLERIERRIRALALRFTA